MMSNPGNCNILALFYFCVFSVQGTTNHPEVRLSHSAGLVKGKYVDAVNNSKVSAFLGIPYAMPPVGILRFAGPVPMESWTDAYEATDFGPACIHQNDTVFPGHNGAEMWNAPNSKSENCLHINVWVPSGGARKKAVMVWIYGGSFYSGTSSLKVYDGRTLAALGDVIVVSFNYRIGPLGFLPPLADSPGNVGFLDQILALTWVQDNIQMFGGDFDNILVFGESAGATSIGLHLVSPLSKGLFNKAIFQSGNQMVPWATVPLHVARERTIKLANHLKCELSSSEMTTFVEREILDCLRSKNADTVFDASWYVNELDIFQFPFVPVLYTDTLPKSPSEITKRGEEMPVDIMVGFNSNEGSYFLIYVVDGFNITTPSFINIDQFKAGVEKSGLHLNQLGLDAVEFFYTDWKNHEKPSRYRDALDNIVADHHIVCPSIEMAKLHQRVGKTYMFHLDYRLSNNVWPDWAGVMHGYDIELVFGIPLSVHSGHNYNSKDKAVSRRMVKYWTNFSKYGNPNGESDWFSTPAGLRSKEWAWQEVTPESTSHLQISDGGDTMKSSYNSFQCAFWGKYIPSISAASSDWNEQETLWKTQFHRWQTYMDQWENKFMTSSKRKRHCRT